MLKLSGLDADSITLEHRDEFADMAEQLDLDPREAEDLVEEYLGAISRLCGCVRCGGRWRRRSSPVSAGAHQFRPISALAPARSTRLVTPREQLPPEAERRRFPAFAEQPRRRDAADHHGQIFDGQPFARSADQNEQPATRVTLRRFFTCPAIPSPSEQYRSV